MSTRSSITSKGPIALKLPITSTFPIRTEAEAEAPFAPDTDEEGEPLTTNLIDLLMAAGVKPDKAKAKVKDFLKPTSATFMELYGRGSVVREANESRRDLNVVGLGALDLRTCKPDGSA